LLRRAVLALVFLLIPDGAFAGLEPDAAVGKALPANGKGQSSAAKLASKPSGKPQGKADSKQAKKPSRYAPVELFQINTKETLKLRFYDDRGKPVKGWQKRFNQFMRCHQTKAVFKMSPRLAQMLYQTSRHFDGRRLEIVSAYRHPKVARNPHSPHKEGVACDFRVVGIANTVLRDFLRKTFDHVGVGYYPNSVFVHLDDRKNGKSAFWIDYSGPGQAAEYAENPIEDLKNGKAEQKRGNGTDTAGRAEGMEDIFEAGAALGNAKPKAKSVQAAPKAPQEVKAASDPFGD
jgi:uncharacterized protein YcbK (DUF882 family)